MYDRGRIANIRIPKCASTLVCVCVCVCACVRACVRVCVCVCEHARAGVCIPVNTISGIGTKLIFIVIYGINNFLFASKISIVYGG